MTMVNAGFIVEKKFNYEASKADIVNKKLLMKILNRNKDTEIGRKFHFSDIKDENDYRKTVPLTRYDYYEEYINRMADGEKNVLISDDIEYLAHTSGTTGKQKMIPITKNSRMRASKYMAFLMNRYTYENFKDKWNYGKTMMISDIVMTSYSKGNIPICSGTSAGMKSISKIIPYIYTSPLEVMMIKDKESSLYLHILFALKERNLLNISGIFISSVLDMFRVMEKYKKELVDDIRKGKINRNIIVDQNLKVKLNSYLSPDSMRADEIEEEFNKGFQGIARRLWKNLVVIESVTGANFSIYDDKVNYYTNHIPIYSTTYAATEGVVALNNDYKVIEYILALDTVFYEFIKEEDIMKDNPKTYLVDEIKIGEKYEIVLTNFIGLYRYRLGDVVMVTGFFKKSPKVTFKYRQNQLLNMAAEKTNEGQMSDAIKNMGKIFRLSLLDYTTEPDNSVSPGRYIVYLECDKRTYDNILKINCERKLYDKMVSKISYELDRQLKISSPAYNRARYNYKLSTLKVFFVKENTFMKMKELMFHEGVSKNQIKIPRVLVKQELFDIIRSNII